MTSFSAISDPRRRVFIQLIGDIRHALNEALTEEYKSRKLTRSDVAKILHTNKSFVSRKLSGESNMTLATLADLAYALDRDVEIALPSRRPEEGSNHHIDIQRLADTAAISSLDPTIVRVSGI